MDRQCSFCGGFCKRSGCERENVKPVREWRGLTDEEIDEAVKSCKTTDTYKYFRAIESALKEKKHMTQPDKPEFGATARWTSDGKIAVVVAVVKPDGNIHIMERVIEPPAKEKNT